MDWVYSEIYVVINYLARCELLLITHYLASGRGVKYCDKHVCLWSVCLSVRIILCCSIMRACALNKR